MIRRTGFKKKKKKGSENSILGSLWVLFFPLSSHEAVWWDEDQDGARALYLPLEPLRVCGGPWSHSCSDSRDRRPLYLWRNLLLCPTEQPGQGRRQGGIGVLRVHRKASQLPRVGAETNGFLSFFSPPSVWEVIKVLGHLFTHAKIVPHASKEMTIRNSCLSHA